MARLVCTSTALYLALWAWGSFFQACGVWIETLLCLSAEDDHENFLMAMHLVSRCKKFNMIHYVLLDLSFNLLSLGFPLLLDPKSRQRRLDTFQPDLSIPQNLLGHLLFMCNKMKNLRLGPAQAQSPTLGWAFGGWAGPQSQARPAPRAGLGLGSARAEPWAWLWHSTRPALNLSKNPDTSEAYYGCYNIKLHPKAPGPGPSSGLLKPKAGPSRRAFEGLGRAFGSLAGLGPAGLGLKARLWTTLLTSTRVFATGSSVPTSDLHIPGLLAKGDHGDFLTAMDSVLRSSDQSLVQDYVSKRLCNN
ncbi:predicted protein [Postia placenta Mad-698-R]|nr:predicted protein [Postia placenta Mad-698-R]